MDNIKPFDGEDRMISATYVPITDYILDADEESAFRNAPIATMSDQGKIRLWGLRLVENEIKNGTIRVTGHRGSDKSPVEITIHSAKREVSMKVSSIEEALKHLMVKESEGGNSANSIADIELQTEKGAIENLEIKKGPSEQTRIAAHFDAAGVTVAVSSLVDYDAANFNIPDEDLRSAACNITDVSLADRMNVAGEPLYREHPNCTGTLRYDTGEALGDYVRRNGPTPSMSFGFSEISDLLRGAAKEKGFCIPKAYHTEDSPAFTDGKLNNSILYAMVHYQTLYSEFFNGGQKYENETFHDVALSNGEFGGGNRILCNLESQERKLCFYGNCPTGGAINNVIGPLMPVLGEHTRPDIHHTIGCGDINSSTLARANVTNTRKWLFDNFNGRPNVADRDKELFWLIAEGAFVNIAMRLRALVKFHTRMTRLSHLTKDTSLLIDYMAGEGAIQVAETLHRRTDLTGTVQKVDLRRLGMKVAMFDEDAQREKFGIAA